MSRSELPEERRKVNDETLIPAGDRLPPDIERQLLEVAGFTRAELYDRRGAIPDRGLVGLLLPGDEVIAVFPDHAQIRRVDGIIQTLWNLRKSRSWAAVEGPQEQPEPTRE